MQIVADLAGGDADIVGPGAGYALRLSVVGNLPGGFPFKLADPNNAVEGSNGTESEVELIKWKDLDYRAKTTFVSDKALGENPSKIRFYWETTLKWTIKVKEFKEVGEQKITEWVNAWPGNATWDTVHRSLCVANAKPKKPIKFFQAGDTITIGADNVAWEKVMQYSCDWTNGEGGEGGNEATIVDAAFTKMSQKNTVGTGARLEINYTLKFGNDRLVRKMLVGNEVQQGDQKTRVIAGSCGAQSGLFAAVCNAQGIEVATERMNLHAPDVVGQRRAVKIAVPFKDVDDDWCDHSNNTNPDFDGPRDADGNPLWWYNSPISSLQVLGGVGCD